MSTEVNKKRFTVDEYYRMAEAGILGWKERVELIDGEIIQMSPIGARHAGRVSRLISLFVRTFGNRAVVGPANPVQLSDWTEPQPDILVLKARPDFYEKKKPKPADVLLVVEVSDTSLRYDMKVKLTFFAAAKIREVWIEDVNKDVLHVFRHPDGGRYTTALKLKRGDSIAPLSFPDIHLSVTDIVGPAQAG